MPPQIHTQRKSPQKFNFPSLNGWLRRYILDMPCSVCQSTSLNSPPLNNGWNVAGSFVGRGLKKPTTVTDVPFESCACLADMWNKRRKMKKLCPCPTVESCCMYQHVKSFQPCFRPVKTLLFVGESTQLPMTIVVHILTSIIGHPTTGLDLQYCMATFSRISRFPPNLGFRGRKPLNPTATKPKND